VHTKRCVTKETKRQMRAKMQMRTLTKDKTSLRKKHCTHADKLAFVDQLHADGLPAAVGRLAEKQFDATHEAIHGEVGEAHDGPLSGLDGDFEQLCRAGRWH
jgi:hypothetical protein